MKPTRYPGIFWISDNRYRIRTTIMDVRTGKLKEVDRIRNCSLQEAVALRAQWRGEMLADAAPIYEAPPRHRLVDYATSWLASKLPHLKPSTAKRYAEMFDLHIVPALGNFYLDALTPVEVGKWVADQSQKYAGWTVTNALRVLRTMMKDAVADLGLPRDPCARVRRPRVNAYSDEDPNLLTGPELAKMLDALREISFEWYALASLMAYTGLRWGEATALKWSDLDVEVGVIHVRRSQWRKIVTGTKTRKTRKVPAVSDLCAILAEHGERLNHMKRGERYRDEGWMFPSRKGSLRHPSAMRKPLRAALEKAGVTTHLTNHGLRRTFNNLGRQVAEQTVLRGIMGHSSVEMTEHYSHVGVDEKQVVQRNVLALVRGER